MVQELVMSDIEALVYRWLIQRKIPFESQVSVRGGVFELGGSRVDFILENMIALRVAGEYWHRGVEKTGSDIIQKEMLSEMGYTVVDLRADDILNNLEQTMRLALLGEESLQ